MIKWDKSRFLFNKNMMIWNKMYGNTNTIHKRGWEKKLWSKN